MPVLYNLTKLAYPTTPAGGEVTFFVASALYVLTPAGVFLAAPYSESLFALLSFLGYYLYVRSTHAYCYPSGLGLGQVGFVMGAGTVWMLGGMVRSNGVLNGAVVLVDFIKEGRILLGGPGAKTKTSAGVVVMGFR